MIETYKDLYAIVDQAMAEKPMEDIKVEIADNQACHLIHTPSGRKMIMMLARLEDEYRVGFAYYEAGQKQALWIDDVIAQGINPSFITELIESHLVTPSNYWLLDGYCVRQDFNLRDKEQGNLNCHDFMALALSPALSRSILVY